MGISFLQLNQYYIRNWTQAPWVGVKNYSPGLDFNAPIGKGVAHSFELTLAFTVIIPYAMPVYVAVIAWGFMLDRDNGALNTLLVDDLHVVGHRPFWLLGTHAFWSIVMTTVWRLWPFAFLMTLAGM